MLALMLAQTPRPRLFMQPNLSPEGGASASNIVVDTAFRFATSSGVGMPAECEDKALLYDTSGRRAYATRYRVDLGVPWEQLWDGGTAWDGGPGSSDCVATCTKGDQWHVAPGDMICMSRYSPRVTRGGDGGSSQLGVLTEGAYRGNQLANTQALDRWQTLSSGVALPVVTANAALSPFGVMEAERVQLPATSGAAQLSLVYSFHGCQNAGNATVASIYVANFDGGTTVTHPDLLFQRVSGEYVEVACDSTGAGDGGLLYTRCYTPPSTAGDINGSFFFGNWARDAGTRTAMDLAVTNGQCEITTFFPTSYIPNSYPYDEVGFAYPGQSRGVDIIAAFLSPSDIPSSPVALSMSTDVIVPGTVSDTSEVFAALTNGSYNYYFQLQSGYNNNVADYSASANLNAVGRIGLAPLQLLWNESNHVAGSWSRDSGILRANLNGTIDAGFFSGSNIDGFVPLSTGYDGVVCPDGGTCAVWNLCGDYSATHSAFGVCKNVCLSLDSDTACQ